MVAFFHASMEPSVAPFLTHFIFSFSTITVIPFVEAARRGRHIALAFPAVVGLMYQALSVGAIMPLYWLIFIVTGAASLHRCAGGEHTKVDQAHAEAAVFGLFVGCIIPTACMLILQDPYVTAIWQAFPLWMSLAQFIHILFRPSHRYPESGYRTVQATYLIVFMLSSSSHIATIWPRIDDHAALKQLFVPSLSAPNPQAFTLEMGALDFLQWDATMSYASTILATFWFARNAKEFLVLIAWYTAAVGAFGPGAAIAGVFLWREALLNAQQPTVDLKATFKQKQG